MSRRIPFFAPVVTLTLATGMVLAQTTSGDLVGTVKDATGANLANAAVVITNQATGAMVTARVTVAGEYRANGLRPGMYDLSVTAPGFAPYVLKGVRVALNATATANLIIPAAGATPATEVSAQAGVVLDTTSINLTQSFSNQELASLPTTTLGAMNYGVLNASLLSPAVASPGGLGQGVGPSVAGQRPRDNNFEVEGIDNNNKDIPGPLVYVPAEAVSSFAFMAGQSSPEFGHSNGGQFNTNIASGANHLHGSVYEYLQNRDLNAGSGTAMNKPASRPRYDYNRYGGQIGGPALHNKAFFFANFERQTTAQTLNYSLCTPTAAGLATLAGLGTPYGLNANNLAQYLKYTPAANAHGGAQVTGANDAACFNGSGAQALTVTSAAYSSSRTSIPLGNYTVNAPNFTVFDALTTSVDYTISPRDSFRGSYVYNTRQMRDTMASLPAFFGTAPEPFRYHLLSLQETHVVTPNISNEFRLGFNRYYHLNQLNLYQNFTFPGLDQFPNLVFGDQGNINLGTDPNARYDSQTVIQLTDNVNYTWRRHAVRIGFEGRKYIAPEFFTPYARGDYEYSNLSYFLQDLAPDSFGQRTAGSTNFYGDQTALYGYLNDTFRVTQKLTLTSGVRYEFTSVPYSERLQSANNFASVAGLLVYTAPQPQKTNFSPRLGISYALDDKTVVRGGFGVSYDVLSDQFGKRELPAGIETTLQVGATYVPKPAVSTAGVVTVPSVVEAALTPAFLAGGGFQLNMVSLLSSNGSNLYGQTYANLVQQNTTGYVPNQVLPYGETFNFTIERTMGSNFKAELGYVGTRGVHLPVQDQLNVQSPVTSATQLTTSATGQTITTSAFNANNLASLLTLTNGNAAAVTAGAPNFIIPHFDAYNYSTTTPHVGTFFTSKINSFQPYGQSNYNALVVNLQRRLQHGLQFNLSYTWSKTLDDAAPPASLTSLTPSRPQDSQFVRGDYGRSALDRTHRATLEAIYDLPFYKHSNNFLKKNLLSNWLISPVYTYESPEYATVLSGALPSPASPVNSSVQPNQYSSFGSQANLNRDSAAMNGGAVINPAGVRGTASTVHAQYSATLQANCGASPQTTLKYTQCQADTVGYIADNSNAYYLQAGPGVLPNSSRNSLATRPIDNFDMTATKRLTFFNHYNFEFSAQAFNLLNHAQYVPGSVDTVRPTTYLNASAFQTIASQSGPSVLNNAFNQPQKVFSNNARTLQLSARIAF